MEIEIKIRITDDEGKYLENVSTYSNRRISSLRDLMLRTTLAQLPGEVEELFDEAENPETVWLSDKPVEKPDTDKKAPVKKAPAKKPAAAKK